MESIIRMFPRALSLVNLARPTCTIPGTLAVNQLVNSKSFHTSAVAAMAYIPQNGPRKWPVNNYKIYPPQTPGEERRPAVTS